MRLERLGHVFSAQDGPDWMVSHAAYPTPVLLGDGRLRIFFNARDASNRGQVGWLDVDPADPTRVVAVSQQPSLMPGALGSFDDRGISLGSILSTKDGLRLYYLGWNKSADVPFRNAIGMALASDGIGTRFERVFAGPILDRSRHDPFTLSYPFVEAPEQGGCWRMLYGTSRNGGIREEAMNHVITEAVSDDGIDWRPSGLDTIALQSGEYGLSRPWIFTREGNRFAVVSIRNAAYSLGLVAWDPARAVWIRQHDQLLGPDFEAWEGGAPCYGATVDVGGRQLMFYCGTGYGQTGFGVAQIRD
ncbi:hypothetical protein ABIE41_000593 [Bosea sp. OAE506]|uniref:hypothetical protein n=1 Tax=Bosea sp. OAE506 TaxID=2663870 RepID=UPI00178B4BD4